MADDWLDGPLPAVLVTYRRDGSAHVSPVWFRRANGAFELVIAVGDAKLGHLRVSVVCGA